MSIRIGNSVITGGGGGQVSDPNFLPTGTIISIETDGSGQFSKLSDAINYLTGKYSNGSVTIQLGQGTFEETESITIDGNKFNISNLEIKGNSNVDTILNLLSESTKPFNLINKVKVSLNDLKVVSENQTGSVIYLNNLSQVTSSNLVISFISGRGISIVSSSYQILNNLTIVGPSSKAGWGVMSSTGGRFNCNGNINLENLIYGLYVYKGGSICLGEGITISTKNVTNKMSSAGGSIYGN